MSYTFYSFKNRTEQDEAMWTEGSFESLVAANQNRRLHGVFDRYLDRPGMKVLEAGCGMGIFVHALREKGHDVLGLDYMASTVRKVRDYDPDFPIEAGDVQELRFEDGTFDAYVSLGVIEHFEEGPQHALAEAYRVLKPGGLAFVTVPCLTLMRRLVAHPMRELFFFFRRLAGKKDYFWEYRYTRKELRRFLEEAGFRIVEETIDDFIPEDDEHHIGLYADYFFLRSRSDEVWKLNLAGRMILRISKLFSPWLVCSGVHLVAIR